MVKGGCHGNYTATSVLAPASVPKRMADFHHARLRTRDKYRNPAVILTDGFVGQMMEPLDLEDIEIQLPTTLASRERPRRELNNSISSNPMNWKPQIRMEANTSARKKLSSALRALLTDDASILLVGYGIVSRVLLSTVEACAKTA